MVALFKIAAFVVPLAFDTFAVAVALGLRGMRPFRPALTFALFEGLMPLIGLFLGGLFGERFATVAVVFGGVVLLAVAARVFREALEEDDEAESLSFSSMRTAALAGFGISTDELAVGFPMGTSGLPKWQTVVAIAVQAFVVTCVGIASGNRLGERFGRRASCAAGVLAAVAFALLGIYLIAQRFVPGLPEV